MSTKNINGVDLYYEIHGKGQPLLLIHGLGSSSRDWEFQLDAFAEHFQVITVDVRGHGRSTKAKGDYSIELFADDIAKLMQELEIPSAHIVSLSMGGMITFQLALDHPELVKSMVIVNSGPGFPLKNIKARLKFGLRFFMIKFLSMEKVGKKIASGLFPNPDQQQLRDLFVERFITNHKPSYIKTMKTLINWNVTKQLDKINCPSLILAADNDYTSIQSKKDYTALMKHAQLQIIKNSHHALPVEKPEEFNQAVLAFISQI